MWLLAAPDRPPVADTSKSTTHRVVMPATGESSASVTPVSWLAAATL